MQSINQYDYIIVGGGSAGATIASRLSESPDVTVCLIEAGAKDSNPAIHVPMGLAALSKFNSISWRYSTEPQLELNARRLYIPRGKVLGGSSSVNAMCYIRGAESDYDLWQKMGATGWGWEQVLPYFKKSQHQERGESEYHGINGPLNVADLRHINPLSEYFIDAAKSAGYQHVTDFNSNNREGVGFYQVTQKGGQRCSSAVGYLKDLNSRKNLTVMTGCMVHKLSFSEGRCMGVEVAINNTKTQFHCRHEVILSSGAINSPKLLMLSGIGPQKELKSHGINCLVNLPGVGQNLQDHLDAIVQHKMKQSIGYGIAIQSIPTYIRSAWSYFWSRQGMLTSNVAEAGAFLRSSLANAAPDLQFHFLPALLEDHGRKTVTGFGCSLHVCYLYPKSRGRVTLKSNNPSDKPLIDPRFLTHSDDQRVMIEGVKIARKILSNAPFTQLKTEPIHPRDEVQSDDEILEFIREKAETIYHPIGTCKIGSHDDDMAVVDSDLKVKGINGLRVVDASVMPTLIGGNTNAPTIMIAEKAADLIKQAKTNSSR